MSRVLGLSDLKTEVPRLIDAHIIRDTPDLRESLRTDSWDGYDTERLLALAQQLDAPEEDTMPDYNALQAEHTTLKTAIAQALDDLVDAVEAERSFVTTLPVGMPASPSPEVPPDLRWLTDKASYAQSWRARMS